jgi:hypothetical protein
LLSPYLFHFKRKVQRYRARVISSCENSRSVVKNNTHSVDSGTIKLWACYLASFATLLSFECKCQVGDPTLPADQTGCLSVIEKSNRRALGCADRAAHLVVAWMQIIESHYERNRQLGYQRTFRSRVGQQLTSFRFKARDANKTESAAGIRSLPRGVFISLATPLRYPRRPEKRTASKWIQFPSIVKEERIHLTMSTEWLTSKCVSCRTHGAWRSREGRPDAQQPLKRFRPTKVRRRSNISILKYPTRLHCRLPRPRPTK